MPPPWPDSLSITSTLPDHCEPTSDFLAAISSYFHICLPTPLALISSTLGVLSIVSWLFSQLPQIFKNYRLQSAEGLSPFFLVEWCLGDTTNLLGAIFAQQAGWQITVASYYVFVDVVLVFQYYWYTYFRGPRVADDKYHSFGDGGNGGFLEGIPPPQGISAHHATSADCDASSDSKDALNAKDTSLGTSPSYSTEKMLSSGRTIRTSRGNSGATSLAVSPRAVLFVSMLCAVLANASSLQRPRNLQNSTIHSQSHESWTVTAGRVSSWASTILYLGSRLPQLYKNYKRKSTSGLSPLLFAAAFGGNLFYSTSLLTNPNAWHDFPPYGGGGWANDDGNNRLEWIGRAIPFFLGAFGVLGLDGAVGVQFMVYGDGDQGEAPFLDRTDNSEGLGKKGPGWFRRWFPSISKGKSTEEESQSLLGRDNGNYGAV